MTVRSTGRPLRVLHTINQQWSSLDGECKTRESSREAKTRASKLPNTQIKSERSNNAQSPAIYASFLNSNCETYKSDEISFLYPWNSAEKKQHDQTLSVTLQNTDSSCSKIGHLRYLKPDGKNNWITALVPT